MCRKMFYVAQAQKVVPMPVNQPRGGPVVMWIIHGEDFNYVNSILCRGDGEPTQESNYQDTRFAYKVL